MKKREKIIGIVMLALIGIYAVMYLSKSREEKLEVIKPIKRPLKKPAAASKPKTEPSEKLDLQRVIEHAKVKSEKWQLSSIRDPFRKGEPKTSGLDFADLLLSGILWEEEEPLALINDQLLKEGDTISGFKVEEIRQDEVVLIKGEKRYVLDLSGGLEEE